MLLLEPCPLSDTKLQKQPNRYLRTFGRVPKLTHAF